MLVSRAAVPVCALCLVGPTSSSSTSLLSLNGGMRVGRPAGDARVSTHAEQDAVRCPGALPITAVQHGQVRQARKHLGRKVGLARHLALQQVEPPQVRQRGLRAPAIPNDHCLATGRCLLLSDWPLFSDWPRARAQSPRHRTSGSSVEMLFIRLLLRSSVVSASRRALLRASRPPEILLSTRINCIGEARRCSGTGECETRGCTVKTRTEPKRRVWVLHRQDSDGAQARGLGLARARL